jgi:hypothetical protein
MQQYIELCRCDLVMTRLPTAVTLAEFETLLNASVPVDAAELNFAYAIRALHLADPESFYKNILSAHTSAQYVILFTTGAYIARYFGLNRVAHITWDAVDKKFVVTPYVAKPRKPDQSEFKPKRYFNSSKTRQLDAGAPDFVPL